MDGKAYEYYRLNRDFPIHSRQTHLRRCPNLIQVRTGELELWINCRKYTLHTGDIVYLSENILVSYEWDDSDLDVMVLNSDIFEMIPSIQALLDKRPSFGCFRDDGRELILGLRTLMANAIQSPNYVEFCDADIRRILLAFVSGAYTPIEPETPAFAPRQLAHLRLVVGKIERSLFQPMKLEDLAEETGLSPKYFCRVFQKMTGQSPFTFINYRRIEQACILLINERISVQDAAARVGYRDVNYFIKYFKRLCGMTPKRFATIYFGTTAYPWY